MPLPASPRARAWIELILVGVLVAASCWVGIELTRHSGRVASIWLANGLLLGILLGAPDERWMRYLAVGFLGNFVANLAVGDLTSIALSLSICNSLEVVMAATLIRHLLGPVVDLRRGRALLVFGAVGVGIAPVISASLAAIVLNESGPPMPIEVFALWFPADALGIGAITPLVLAITQGAAWDHLQRARWRLLRSATPLLLMALLIFWQESLPLLFLGFPPLLFLVYREGTHGAVVGTTILMVMAVAMTGHTLVLSPGSHGPLQSPTLLIQCYIATASAVALTIASLLEQSKVLAQGLRTAERLQRAVVDNTPALILHADAGQRIRFANTAMARALGGHAQEFVGRTIREVVDPERYARISPNILQVLNGSAVQFESCESHPEGKRYYQSSYVPELDASGQVQGFYAMSFNVTERKTAELLHAAGEERLRTITDNLPVLIAYLDADRVFRFCNSAHEALLGIAPDQLLGRRIDEALEPKMYEAQRYFFDCALNGARSEGSFEIEGPKGRRHLQLNLLPHIDAAGQVIGVYALTMDVTPLKRVEQQLRQLARYDSLTGLANRREFNERLSVALARSRRIGNSLAVLFLDIDHFKKINDSCGHAGGDEILQEVALRIRSAVRQTDTVARLAGDEFVILLDQLLSAEEPLFVARKVVASMERPFVIDRGSISVSVSVGIAMDTQRNASAEQLLQRADRALYAAKSAGRNTFRMADA